MSDQPNMTPEQQKLYEEFMREAHELQMDILARVDGISCHKVIIACMHVIHEMVGQLPSAERHRIAGKIRDEFVPALEAIEGEPTTLTVQH
jgi:hypothetical protein